MKLARLTLATIIVSIGSTLTYFIFEAVVSGAINLVWVDWLQTDTARWLVLPLCVALSFGYFASVHFFDKKASNDESALGEVPKPTVSNYLKVISIGFLSLFAGASLGPEAILVPACMMVGLYAGTKLFPRQQQVIKLLGLAGFIALFTSFFNSFAIGFLSVFLAAKQAGIKADRIILAIAALSSAVAALLLHFLKAEAFVKTPTKVWNFHPDHIVIVIGLVASGVMITLLLRVAVDVVSKLRSTAIFRHWTMQAAVASAGLSVIYLIGGPLIEFTGSQSIVPMLQRAPALGTIGLLGLALTKIAAIGWSKAIGYRGGLIFPSIFIASVLVAIAGQYTEGLSFIIGLGAVMVGLIAANQKLKVLF
jgi:hypothetical protein